MRQEVLYCFVQSVEVMAENDFKWYGIFVVLFGTIYFEHCRPHH